MKQAGPQALRRLGVVASRTRTATVPVSLVLTIALAAVFVVVAVMWCRRRESFSQSQLPHAHQLEVIYVGASWCGFCKAFDAEWHKVVAAGLPGVRLTKVDADRDKPLVAALGVTGFPTVLMRRDGKSTEYRGARDADALIAAIKAKIA